MKIGCPGIQASLQGGIVKGKVIDVIVYLMQKIDEKGKGFGHRIEPFATDHANARGKPENQFGPGKTNQHRP